MLFRSVIKMFEDGNVFVVGLRGKGKDMLTGNVIVRRNKPYISNTKYEDNGLYIPLEVEKLNMAGNTYQNLIDGDIKNYVYPYPDGIDVYISDLGLYFPAQYCNELNRKYSYLSMYFALCRQLGLNNCHGNLQALNRAYDKLREQGDQYIMCLWCKVFHGFVIQRIRIYEQYDACVKRVPPYRVPKPLMGADRIQRWELDKQHYEITYGTIKNRWLFYRNKSTYNTRIFKEMFEHGKE